MTPKSFFTKFISRLTIGVCVAVSLFTLVVPTPVFAQTFPSLESFTSSVKNGNADQLRGIYVPNVMAYAIMQQPENDAAFVAEKSGVVTEFGMATMAGNVGLLAHNTYAGKSFFNIPAGSQVVLVYGNGATKTFVVEQIVSYEALPYGQYRNLKDDSISNTGDIFDMAYAGEYHLTLQTCIEQDGDVSWGRMFIIAKPEEFLPSAAR